MMESVARKSDIWRFLGLLAIVFVGLAFFLTMKMENLNETTSDLSDIEYMNSSTQRLVRIVILGRTDDKLLYHIDTRTTEFFSADSEEQLAVLEDSPNAELAAEVLSNWKSIHHMIANEGGSDIYMLDLAADNHFTKMTDLTNAVSVQIEAINAEIKGIQLVINGLVVAAIIMLVSHFIQTHASLQRAEELAKVAAIDTATGLFNRSKCQDLFKVTSATTEKKRPGIIVVDLNDLKKTNDLQGHRVGDELIFSFASLIREACNAHVNKPFVGRYGGDEFIIYYRDLKDDTEINVFTKELEFLTNEFNGKSDRFKISYALGYSLAEENSKITVRELFNEADEAMYKNKEEKKRKIRELQQQKEDGSRDTNLTSKA